MKILGINDAHNAAACLYQDGHIVAAIQEERLRRVKNWSGLPLQAVRAVLEMTGTPVGEIDAVAMNGHYAPNPMTREQLMEEYRTVNDPRVTARRALRRTVRRAMGPRLYTAYLGRRQRARVRDLLELGIPWEKIDFVEHHTAHAAAAYYGWGKFEDPVLVLTCDGVGDGLCATVSIGRNGHLERLHAVGEGDSIGNIYAMVTFLMGMVPLEHEYKLMGLAPYADPRGADQVFRELARLIRVDPKAPLGWERTEAVRQRRRRDAEVHRVRRHRVGAALRARNGHPPPRPQRRRLHERQGEQGDHGPSRGGGPVRLPVLRRRDQRHGGRVLGACADGRRGEDGAPPRRLLGAGVFRRADRGGSADLPLLIGGPHHPRNADRATGRPPVGRGEGGGALQGTGRVRGARAGQPVDPGQSVRPRRGPGDQ
ncbi:MAG: hypothetical protein E6H04_12390 [Bacillati bacterium ANGP1]|uniref:Carbamoyltransferase domain-containing protein n=1 Tax=Candidatus Segetimicrobium genomatis TaxID=2569760 RepID=A0A537J4H9_9BACT|nr:MAG: hypothetical protein E6H04_12390 [Terrabacteria group bacterium ANGP1]